ncbi:MAG TPA: LuxR C-terminal-related transcriptional regulator [Nevskiaceae bacterium]|nr:LuxR C-terminal-related transcriptional regulator [Nevskiaceae bacterium]
MPNTAAPSPRPGVYAYKLQAPPARGGLIHRQALMARIAAHPEARLVLLQAPAGHGKTTCLQQLRAICEAQGLLCGWLSCDEADNDSRRFFLHLLALAADLAQAAGRAPLPEDGAILTSRRRRSDWIIERLQAVERPLALFIDEFQLIHHPTLIGFFRDLFERLPDGIRLFVGSRSLPELGLSRLLVNQQALMIRAEDLRFSREEAEAFLGDLQPALSSAEREAIFRRTEGWPAALQLYRLAMASPVVRQSLLETGQGRPRELAEYLADNVLALQTPAVQRFLLRSALLPRLCAPLCDAVMEDSGSQAQLAELERAGLFLRGLDAEGRWFKFHTLFASFLAEQLQAREPDTVRAVHHRAADWHAASQDWEGVMHHALAAGEIDRAAETLERWSADLVAAAALVTLERWSARLPEEAITRRPRLAVRTAWALVFLRRRSRLEPLLQALRARPPGSLAETTDPRIVLAMAQVGADDPLGAHAIASQWPTEPAPELEGFAAFELGAASNLRAFLTLAAGQFDLAREYLVQARVYNSRSQASFSRGYTMALEGLSLMAQGQLQAALERYAEGLQPIRREVDKSHAAAALVSCYVWALYEANRLDEAEALFGQYHPTIAESALPYFLVLAFVAMARIHAVRGRAGAAEAVLDEVDTLSHEQGWKRPQQMIVWERVRRALMAGALERAEALAALAPSVEPLPGGGVMFGEDLEGERLGRIRLALHAGQLERAAELLADEQTQQRERSLRQLRLLLLEALLQQARGQPNAAQRSLRRALQRVGREPWQRAFLDEGEPLLALLRQAYQSRLSMETRDSAEESERALLERLLQASGMDLSRAPAGPGSEPLGAITEREREILEWLSRGASNRDIALRLAVSENTVKFHLKNLYSKLAVASRLQAISSARQLGLVE